MNPQDRPLNNRQHWLLRELLVRYVEALKAGEDADHMYPEVALHVRGCLQCRAAVASLLWPDGITPERKIRASDLAFLSSESQLESVLLSPGSDITDFRIHISLPIAGFLEGQPVSAALESPMRGFSPIQPGGRLLLFDTIALGDTQVQAMLTLHKSDAPNRYTIVGELSSDSLPPVINARLHVGHDVYFADVLDGMLSFEGVFFPDTTERISITLELPG